MVIAPWHLHVRRIFAYSISMETTVYCNKCGRSRVFSPELWESKYRDIISGKNGAMMLCDDPDCFGIYQLEKPAMIRRESA